MWQKQRELGNRSTDGAVGLKVETTRARFVVIGAAPKIAGVYLLLSPGGARGSLLLQRRRAPRGATGRSTTAVLGPDESSVSSTVRSVAASCERRRLGTLVSGSAARHLAVDEAVAFLHMTDVRRVKVSPGWQLR